MGEAIRLDKLVIHCEASGGGARIDPQLVVDRGQVRVDGARADDELFGHLDVGQSLRHQPQHLYFTCRQSFRIASW